MAAAIVLHSSHITYITGDSSHAAIWQETANISK